MDHKDNKKRLTGVNMGIMGWKAHRARLEEEVPESKGKWNASLRWAEARSKADETSGNSLA